MGYTTTLQQQQRQQKKTFKVQCEKLESQKPKKKFYVFKMKQITQNRLGLISFFGWTVANTQSKKNLYK